MGVDEAEFYRHFLIQDGVLRQREIVGEAVKQLSEELRLLHPNIPWRDISGMRDKLIHAYFGVNMEAVWLTATMGIPFFKAEVQNMLGEQNI